MISLIWPCSSSSGTLWRKNLIQTLYFGAQMIVLVFALGSLGAATAGLSVLTPFSFPLWLEDFLWIWAGSSTSTITKALCFLASRFRVERIFLLVVGRDSWPLQECAWPTQMWGHLSLTWKHPEFECIWLRTETLLGHHPLSTQPGTKYPHKVWEYFYPSSDNKLVLRNQCIWNEVSIDPHQGFSRTGTTLFGGSCTRCSPLSQA